MAKHNMEVAGVKKINKRFASSWREWVHKTLNKRKKVHKRDKKRSV